MGKVEVLLARIVSPETISSSCLNRSFLAGRSSRTASTTKSASWTHGSSSETISIRSSTASGSSPGESPSRAFWSMLTRIRSFRVSRARAAES